MRRTKPSTSIARYISLIALAILVAGPPVAAAPMNDRIYAPRLQTSTGYVTITQVHISVDGYLEVRTRNGRLLATEDMKAGSNRGRNIAFNLPQRTGVILLLFAENGTLLDSQKVTIHKKLKRRK